MAHTYGVTGGEDQWQCTAFDPVARRRVRVKNPQTGGYTFETRSAAMAAQKAVKERWGKTITIRLNEQALDRLADLSTYFAGLDPLGRPPTVSDIVRSGIDLLWAEHR